MTQTGNPNYLDYDYNGGFATTRNSSLKHYFIRSLAEFSDES